MANYLLDQTGEEVQAILNAVQAPDTTPVAGSTKLITSGGVQAALAGTAQELDDKVAELGHEVSGLKDLLGATEENFTFPLDATIYKSDYYINNTDGSDVSFAGRAIARSTGWKTGDTIRISYLKSGGTSSSAIALYKNGVFVKSLLSGIGSPSFVVISTQTDFTPTEDFDEVRFSLVTADLTNVSGVKIRPGFVSDLVNDIDNGPNLNLVINSISGEAIKVPGRPSGSKNVSGTFNSWFGFSKREDLPNNGFLVGVSFYGSLSSDMTFKARISKKVKSGGTITGLTSIEEFDFLLPANQSSVTFSEKHPFYKDYVLELYIGTNLPAGLIKSIPNPDASEWFRFVNQSVATGLIWDYNAVIVPNVDLHDKKAIKILAVGNSHAQDAFAYVPFIVKNCFPSIELTMGLLYYGGCSLQLHEQHFDTPEDTSYYYYKINPSDNSWNTESAGTSIQSALADEDWDVIVMQQNSANESDYTTFQPYLNSLIRKFQSVLTKPVRFAWLFPEVPETNLATSVTKFAEFATNVQKVLDETAVSILFPASAGMQNARTTSLQSLGGGGNMLYTDNHAQEGIPCYCLALPCALVVADLCGYSFEGIYGDTNIPTASWVSEHAIPGQNGPSVGATAANCLTAQLCAIMAVKKPLEITDMVGLGIVTE